MNEKYSHYLYHEGIRKLEIACDDLANGKKHIHPTKFNMVHPHLKYTGLDNFFTYLLEQSKKHYLEGRSIAQKEIIPHEEKTLLYDNTIRQVALEETVERIKSLAGNWFRRYIHSYRWRIDDFDMVLLYMVCICRLDKRENSAHDTNFVITSYCATGQNYSWKMTKESIPRIKDIIDYLKSTKV